LGDSDISGAILLFLLWCRNW